MFAGVQAYFNEGKALSYDKGGVVGGEVPEVIGEEETLFRQGDKLVVRDTQGKWKETKKKTWNFLIR